MTAVSPLSICCTCSTPPPPPGACPAGYSGAHYTNGDIHGDLTPDAALDTPPTGWYQDSTSERLKHSTQTARSEYLYAVPFTNDDDRVEFVATGKVYSLDGGIVLKIKNVSGQRLWVYAYMTDTGTSFKMDVFYDNPTFDPLSDPTVVEHWTRTWPGAGTVQPTYIKITVQDLGYGPVKIRAEASAGSGGSFAEFYLTGYQLCVLSDMVGNADPSEPTDSSVGWVTPDDPTVGPGVPGPTDPFYLCGATVCLSSFTASGLYSAGSSCTGSCGATAPTSLTQSNADRSCFGDSLDTLIPGFDHTRIFFIGPVPLSLVPSGGSDYLAGSLLVLYCDSGSTTLKAALLNVSGSNYCLDTYQPSWVTPWDWTTLTGVLDLNIPLDTYCGCDPGSPGYAHVRLDAVTGPCSGGGGLGPAEFDDLCVFAHGKCYLPNFGDAPCACRPNTPTGPPASYLEFFGGGPPCDPCDPAIPGIAKAAAVICPTGAFYRYYGTFPPGPGETAFYSAWRKLRWDGTTLLLPREYHPKPTDVECYPFPGLCTRTNGTGFGPIPPQSVGPDPHPFLEQIGWPWWLSYGIDSASLEAFDECCYTMEGHLGTYFARYVFARYEVSYDKCLALVSGTTLTFTKTFQADPVDLAAQSAADTSGCAIVPPDPDLIDMPTWPSSLTVVLL